MILNDIIHIRGNEELVTSIQSIAGCIEHQYLWIKAFNKLSPAESTTLKRFQLVADSQDTILNVKSIQKETKKVMDSKRDSVWKIK
jgi:hypothetical protein